MTELSEQELTEIEARADDVLRLLAEASRLRYALLHRCVVAAVDPNCEDCRVIIDVLGPASDRESATD